MIVFFIQELLLLFLLICSPKLNSHVHLFFNHSLTVEMLGIGLLTVSWRGLWELADLLPTVFGYQTLRRSHCLYSWDPAEDLRFVNPYNSEHWTDLSTVGWLLPLIFGMSSQLIWFYRERLVGGAPYWKMCSIVYALDLHHMYVSTRDYNIKQLCSITLYAATKHLSIEEVTMQGY